MERINIARKGGIEMFKVMKKVSLLSIALCSLGVSTYAEELSIWTIPDTKGKAPIFYQEASNSSKPVTLFKPNQNVHVLSKQKDWAKISALDNSGQIAWVPAEEVKSVTTLALTLKQDANAYQCQVRIRDPQGREAGNWRLAHRMLEPSEKNSKGIKGWSFGKKNISVKEESWGKELDELEIAFSKQHTAMMNMMRHMFSIAAEEPVEKAISTSEPAQLAEKTKTENAAKPSETKLEEKQPVIAQKEKTS